jgi:hypothetical protein
VLENVAVGKQVCDINDGLYKPVRKTKHSNLYLRNGRWEMLSPANSILKRIDICRYTTNEGVVDRPCFVTGWIFCISLRWP